MQVISLLNTHNQIELIEVLLYNKIPFLGVYLTTSWTRVKEDGAGQPMHLADGIPTEVGRMVATGVNFNESGTP